MAAFELEHPPIDTLHFISNFLIREITPKTRVFWTPHVGAHTKNEIILEKNRFYMVRKFFLPKKSLFSMGILGGLAPIYNGDLGQNPSKSPLKTGTFLVRKISWPCRADFFPKFFRFLHSANRVSAKKTTFLKNIAYRKNRAKRQVLYGGIM